MKYYGATNIGLVRTNNEDNFITLRLAQNACLLVVCDGMGGLEYGEVASRIAIDTFVNKIRSATAPFITADVLSNFAERRVSYALENAIVSANQAVLEEINNRNTENKVMGSTLVGILLINEHAYVVNIGDSRAYVCMNDRFIQITKDHSYVQMLIDEGMLTEQEAKEHPKRNAITRAIGLSNSVVPDFFRIDLKAGSRMLLCSDGLTGYSSVEDIEKLINSSLDPQIVCDELITCALAGGGRDNITVVVLDY